MITRAPTRRAPVGRGWRFRETITYPELVAGRVRKADVWDRSGLRVLSELAYADLPDGAGVGPQWFVSVSYRRKRAPEKLVQRALRAFRMVGAEEDNHHPGVARGFWLPVDPAHRVDCECKVSELTITEPDGYRWQNARDPGACRGCEYAELFGKPCPIHAPRSPRPAE